ncbi:MAG: hypothetical protein KDD01_26965 [Phaeodactylibacter sp.]|nr:hypothetical protein [Phaeodactylibacter sp.]
MESLIHQKLQGLEQIRHNLLQNIRSSEEPARSYQQLSLEVVTGCQEALRQVEEVLKNLEDVSRNK